MKKHSLKIHKIPSPKSPLYRQEFIPQPVNYLKIIENPDKIKIDHLTRSINDSDLKSLEHRHLSYPNPEPFIPPVETEKIQQDTTNMNVYTRTHTDIPIPPKPVSVNNISKYKFEIPPDSDDDDDFDSEPKFNRFTVIQPEEPKILAPPKPPPQTPPTFQSQFPPSNCTPPPSPLTPLGLSPSNYTPPPLSPLQSSFTPPPPHYTPPPPSPPSQSQTNVIHSRLKDFLQYSDNDSDNDSNTGRTYQYKEGKRIVDPYKYMSKNQREFTDHSYEPPTLDQLEETGEFIAQPIFLQAQQLDELYNNQQSQQQSQQQFQRQQSLYNEPRVLSFEENQILEEEDSIDDKKRELLTKLDFLRMKYPAYSKTIPELTMQTGYNEMKSIYQIELKKLEINNNVTNYRQYLMGGFMFTEYILGRFLRIDMEGFTQQQIINMRQYEIFLIEIGEKNYVPEGKKWPVELRLCIYIVLQAVMFTASKLILQKTGSNLLGMLNDSLLPQQMHKKKVKRPDINIDDL